MKIIIKQAVEHFLGYKKGDNAQDNKESQIKKGSDDKKVPDERKVLDYIKAHPFFDSALPCNSMAREIRDRIKESCSQGPQIQRKIEQLGLYLKRDTNKLMFQIYEFILRNPRGVTYKDIQKRTGLEIVNISHYCCRLRKMNFVDLRHQKSQKVVYPKAESSLIRQQPEEDSQSAVGPPFFFHELSMVDNIWINVSGVEAFHKNGITNEEIKSKLRKASQTKLVMKLVEQVKETYKFERQMVSEGKVFEHKYRNITEQVAALAKIGRQEQEPEEKLSENVEKWLKCKFPQFTSQNFLLQFINEELRSYFSANGTKIARRACTPIKLIRYIKILNSLNQKWPQTHNELKRFLIEEEREIPNNGIMHKRSIVGILDGLVEKGILRNEQEFYYPQWEASQQKPREREYDEEIKNLPEYKPRKKTHLSSLAEKQIKGIPVSVKDYRKELKNQLMIEELKELVKMRLRAAFKRIMYARRKRAQVQAYEPQKHVLHLLEKPSFCFPTFHADTYEDFINQIDGFVEEQGHRQQPISVTADIARLFKRYPSRKHDHMKIKYGGNWEEKVEPLVSNGFLKVQEKEVTVVAESDRFFI